jgi:hypothetical protein
LRNQSDPRDNNYYAKDNNLNSKRKIGIGIRQTQSSIFKDSELASNLKMTYPMSNFKKAKEIILSLFVLIMRRKIKLLPFIEFHNLAHKAVLLKEEV